MPNISEEIVDSFLLSNEGLANADNGAEDLSSLAMAPTLFLLLLLTLFSVGCYAQLFQLI